MAVTYSSGPQMAGMRDHDDVHDTQYILDRVDHLKQSNADVQDEKWRIRAIMNGGADGVNAVMAWNMGKGNSPGRVHEQIGVDLPTVNLVASGLDRLAQQLGRPPTLKAPEADDEPLRRKNQRRIDIVAGWDRATHLDLHYPQLGRWLPGYGYAMWTMKMKRFGTDLVPYAELKDPYDVYPGWFGPDQQPGEAVYSRIVPLHVIEKAYPELPWEMLEGELRAKRAAGPVVVADTRLGVGAKTRSWEGRQTGVVVDEYWCRCGVHIVIPELERQLTWIENPTDSLPFVFMKRFSFDRNVSQYHHVIGLMAQLAKMNVLGLIVAEDAAFRETNIIGDIESGTYERGRFATNFFTPGTKIEKSQVDQVNQVWAQIDRLERQLRVGALYDVQQDAISPNSWATGQGMRELQSSPAANVREYQTVLAHGAELIDAKRLELAEAVYGTRPQTYYDMYGKQKTYRPAQAIGGDYRTQRIWGAMATFDDAQKIVAGLQLLQGGIIDVETLQENIDGLRNLPLINERIAARKAEDTMYQMLAAETQQNPAAKAAMAEIMTNPKDRYDILLKYFAPQEPMLSPEEQQMMSQLGGGGAPQGPPPDVSTVLSRLEMGGGAEGGVQTVGQLPG